MAVSSSLASRLSLGSFSLSLLKTFISESSSSSNCFVYFASVDVGITLGKPLKPSDSFNFVVGGKLDSYEVFWAFDPVLPDELVEVGLDTAEVLDCPAKPGLKAGEAFAGG